VANLLVAALVSAVVALGVEWLAKPRLEARKERLLRRYRARDEVRRLLGDVLFNATKLKIQSPPVNAHGDEVGRASSEIATAISSFEDTFRAELMPSTRDEIIGVLASYVGFVRGVLGSDRADADKGAQIATHTSAAIDILGGPGQGWLYWARWRYRARQLRALKTFLDA
jgi:hypothetical protein